MNKNWVYLVVFGILATFLVIGWDVFATFTGLKTEFSFKINKIENKLYGPIEDHFKTDPNFTNFENLARAEEVKLDGDN